MLSLTMNQVELFSKLSLIISQNYFISFNSVCQQKISHFNQKYYLFMKCCGVYKIIIKVIDLSTLHFIITKYTCHSLF